jgi:hypothetical protein
MSTSPTILESQTAAPRDETPRRRGVAGVMGAAALTALLMPVAVGAAAPHSSADGITARPPALQRPIQRCTPMPPTFFAPRGRIDLVRVSVPVQLLTHCLGHGPYPHRFI